MKRVLVTGGLGFVGKNLVEELLRRDVESIIIVDDCSNSTPILPKEWAKDKIKHIKTSVLEVGWLSYLEKVDAVFHLACKTVLECDDRPVYDLEVNSRSTLQILEAIRSLPVDKQPAFLYTSSACVYGLAPSYQINEDYPVSPNHQYGVSKLTAELYTRMYAKTHKLKTVSVRLSNAYGKYQTPKNPYCGVIGIFINNAKTDKALNIFGNGEQTRDFTYINDVTSAICTIVEQDNLDGSVYNVSYGEAISVNEVAESVKEHYPDAETVYLPERLIDDIKHRYLDSSKIKNKLQLKDFTDLKEGIKNTIQQSDGSL